MYCNKQNTNMLYISLIALTVGKVCNIFHSLSNENVNNLHI